jgi:thiamine kinase-like enzyme
MEPADLAGVAGRHLPGSGPLEMRRLDTGLVNDTYRIRRDGADYALRVAGSSQNELGFDRTWEAGVLEHAVRAGLAPPVVYNDPVSGILITQWVDGRAWSPQEAGQRAAILQTAPLLQRIHALPLPHPARSMGPLQWIRLYSAAAGNGAAPGVLMPAASERLEVLSTLPAHKSVLCHSDLHVENLLDRGGSLMLLDWEYAHAADPFWDLAGWSDNNDFAECATAELLACYLGRDPTHGERLRLQLLCWLYDYVCLLWCTVYLKIRNGRAAPSPADGRSEGVAARADHLAARLAARASSRGG